MSDDTPPPEWWDSVRGAGWVLAVMFWLTLAAWLAFVSDPSVTRAGAVFAGAVGCWLSMLNYRAALRARLDEIRRRIDELDRLASDAERRRG